MRYYLVLLLFLGVLPGVLADILITEVMYNPETSEFDTEYLELYNQGEQAVDISGWMINTTTLQATIPEETAIAANSFFLIADDDDNGNWPINWPEPDYNNEEISLGNTNSGVVLIDSANNVVDAVGWGAPASGLFEGTPHNGVAEGESLTRIQQNSTYVDTNNNYNDFVASSPSPSNSRNGNGEAFQIDLVAHVTGNIPKIDLIEVLPDDASEPGIQVMPVPAASKEITVIAIATDFDGYDDVRDVWAQLYFGDLFLDFDSQLNDTSATYTSTFNMSFYNSPGNYSVVVVVDDQSNQSSTANSSYEFLELLAFDIDTASIVHNGGPGSYSEVLGDVDFSTVNSPTIRNLGNIPLDFQIFGVDLSSGLNTIGVGNVEYTFLDNDYSNGVSGVISTQPAHVALNFAPGASQLREFTTRLFIPLGTSMGTYSGSLSLIGMVG